MQQCVVQVTVTRRVPVLLVVSGSFWAWQQSLLEDTGVSRLVEGRDAQLLVSILFDDPEGIFVSVERSHEDQRDVHAMGGVEVLDLTHGQVEEGHIIFYLKSALGSRHS